MKAIYISTRKELTEQLIENRLKGFDCYRLRLACGCNNYQQDKDFAYHKANQRHGIIVLDGDRAVKMYIRCKMCHKNMDS